MKLVKICCRMCKRRIQWNANEQKHADKQQMQWIRWTYTIGIWYETKFITFCKVNNVKRIKITQCQINGNHKGVYWCFHHMRCVQISISFFSPPIFSFRFFLFCVTFFSLVAWLGQCFLILLYCPSNARKNAHSEKKLLMRQFVQQLRASLHIFQFCICVHQF